MWHLIFNTEDLSTNDLGNIIYFYLRAAEKICLIGLQKVIAVDKTQSPIFNISVTKKKEKR